MNTIFSNAGTEVEMMLNEKLGEFSAHNMLAGNYILITRSDACSNLPFLSCASYILIAENNGPAVTDASHYIAYILDHKSTGNYDIVKAYDAEPQKDLFISPKTLEEWAGGSVWYGKKGELHQFAMSMLEIDRHARVTGGESSEDDDEFHQMDKIDMWILKPSRTRPLKAKTVVEIGHRSNFNFGDCYANCKEQKKAGEIASSSWMQDQLGAYHHLQNLLFRRHDHTVFLLGFNPAKAIESAADGTSNTPAKLHSLYAHFKSPLRAYRCVADSKRKSDVDRVNNTVCKRPCQ